jgi:hypothetical protein
MGGEGDGSAPLNPFTVFVREDGTVDWDGVIESGKVSGTPPLPRQGNHINLINIKLYILI